MRSESLRSVALNLIVQRLIPSVYHLLRFVFLNIPWSEDTMLAPQAHRSYSISGHHLSCVPNNLPLGFILRLVLLNINTGGIASYCRLQYSLRSGICWVSCLEPCPSSVPSIEQTVTRMPFVAVQALQSSGQHAPAGRVGPVSPLNPDCISLRHLMTSVS